MNRLLIDTNVLIWWFQDSPRLSKDVCARISAPENEVFVSTASIWEIEIKRAIGKMEAPVDLIAEIETEGFRLLAIEPRHAITAGRLPKIHADPFDRMLVAQASIENLLLVTSDQVLPQYGIPTLAAKQ